MDALPTLRRLGLARGPGDILWETATAAGWQPHSLFVTEMTPTHAPVPITRPDGVIVLSPSGARFAEIPTGVPVLATGAGTAQALALTLAGCEVVLPRNPSAEGLWTELRERFPSGGDFLLIRAQRSRAYLEAEAGGSPWRIHAWITHGEQALDPLPDVSHLEAVLALSPFQAELLGPLASNLLRLAWGHRSAEGFIRSGFPAHAVCEHKPEALLETLRRCLNR